jgi:hypothetical protein
MKNHEIAAEIIANLRPLIERAGDTLGTDPHKVFESSDSMTLYADFIGEDGKPRQLVLEASVFDRRG